MIPLKFAKLPGKNNFLVVFKNDKISKFYKLVGKTGIEQTRFLQNSMTNRNIDVDTHNDLQMNKNGPLIGFLFDETKIEVYSGDMYTVKYERNISQWSQDPLEQTQGFIIFLPYSDFLVTGKYGESKVMFLNYLYGY